METDWIQIEVTSHCNGECVYCPHTVYRDAWINRHLPLPTFEKLLPIFATTNLVYLQGWGEPLLHPDFFTLVTMAKKTGCRVGFTTNGTLLTKEVARQVVESDVDIIAFSLAGLHERNDTIRKGTSFELIVEAVRTINRIKEEKRTTRPVIHIAYMLLRSALREATEIPSSLSKINVDQVVINTLDFVPSISLKNEAFIFSTTHDYEKLRSFLNHLVIEGENRGVQIAYYLGTPDHQQLLCSENVHCALFVAANGSVSPCVFTNLPVTHATYVVNGVEQPWQQVIFGNVNDKSLDTIWQNEAYVEFRESFETGRLAPCCSGCRKLHIG